MAEKKSKKQEDKEKNMQESYMQFQMINQQMQELQKQVQQIEEAIQEVNESKKSLDQLSKEEKNKEILVPIVSGIFAKAELKDAKEFVVNVGANTAVVKSISEVQKLLDKQMNDMQTTQGTFIDNLQKMTLKAKELETKLKLLVEG